MIETVLEAILMKEMRRAIEASGAEHVLPGDALMLPIVQRVTDTRMGHPNVLVDFVEQHRRQARLPVVAMDDVWMFAALEHEFQRRAAKKGEALVIISMAVKYVAVKKILVRMRLDKKA